MFKFLHSQHFQTVINAFCNTHSANDSYDLDGAKWKIHILHFFFFSDKEKCVCRGCFILKKLLRARGGHGPCRRGAAPLCPGSRLDGDRAAFPVCTKADLTLGEDSKLWSVPFSPADCT